MRKKFLNFATIKHRLYYRFKLIVNCISGLSIFKNFPHISYIAQIKKFHIYSYLNSNSKGSSKPMMKISMQTLYSPSKKMSRSDLRFSKPSPTKWTSSKIKV